MRIFAAVMVEGVDHGVAAAAAGLGGELRDDAADERADRRQQHQQPGAEVRGVADLGQEGLAAGAQRPVAAQILEHQPLHQLERGEERGAHQPGRRADDRGVGQRAADDAQIGRRRFLQDRRQKLAADDPFHQKGASWIMPVVYGAGTNFDGRRRFLRSGRDARPHEPRPRVCLQRAQPAGDPEEHHQDGRHDAQRPAVPGDRLFQPAPLQRHLLHSLQGRVRGPAARAGRRAVRHGPAAVDLPGRLRAHRQIASARAAAGAGDRRARPHGGAARQAPQDRRLCDQSPGVRRRIRHRAASCRP